MDGRKRRWCLTIWDEAFPEFDESWLTYALFGKETCPDTGRHHWQSYIETKVPLRMNTVIANLCLDIHPSVRSCDGDQWSNMVYCSKEGEWVEFGAPMAQGQRTDLQDMVDQVLEGKLTVDDLMMTNAHAVHLYGRVLERAENMYLRTQERDREMPEVFWLCGTTGAGKSHKIYEEFIKGKRQHVDYYPWVPDGGWWDNYKGHEIVVMNEFRGQIAFSELLCLCDKWPYSVRRRNLPPVPFMAKKIFISCSRKPEDQYAGVGEDIQQLLRRVKVIEH